ncbi:alpha/beta fold hydrolase [Burkholderia contaminans]|uniref:alpha/beta fold hydrolase n=2 Tax=Burkholderia contaminans TaxID=488447 RepID=UPI000AAFA0F2|nr:alpha/beta hydrolase [Burkholderia contaminans]MEB4636815.1 alpha/beta hydrolase [Burkholderia contaminans]MEB4651642.1 alpha/beta hydrolase [Burkholderia contaminans]MEB4661213.1 alpha/beta hydrolase [Burkholderia contaminans]MEB4667177.1 alpha/beta hydrolase [Burkholderia contaminans]MEB4678443.1 alpha/beta hydrolase [Burkholderia contaminans]
MNPIPDDLLEFRIGARPVRSMRLDGGILAAQVGDEPPAVVVLNGGQAFVSRATLRRLRPDLRRVAGILPPGTPFVLLGYPDKPGTQYRITDIVEHIAHGIATHWQCTALIGISFGGVVAARRAAAHPVLVSRLALVSSAHRLRGLPARRAANRLRDSLRFRQSARNDVRMLPHRLAQHASPRSVVRSTPPRHVTSSVNERHVIVRTLRALRDDARDGSSWPSRIRADTLIVCGAVDPIFADAARETSARVPSATHHALAGEGHIAMFERRRQVARLIRNWLDPRS